MWDKVVEKAVNAETKTSLQPPSGTKEINSRCPRSYRPSVKKDKDDTNRKHQDKALKDKAKSHNSFFANQSQTQASKKRHRSRQGDHPATQVNFTKVAKMDNDKIKYLSYIKCYTYKQKGHYTNKYSKKYKN